MSSLRHGGAQHRTCKRPYFKVKVKPYCGADPEAVARGDVIVSITVAAAGTGHTSHRQTRPWQLPRPAMLALVDQLTTGAKSRNVPCPIEWVNFPTPEVP